MHAGRRSVVNEDALLDRFRKVTGVTVHSFQHESEESDAEAFHNADIVFGLHGGALCNLVYCRIGTPVIEMNEGMSDGERGREKGGRGGRQCFGYIANSLGLSYWRYGLKDDHYVSAIPDFYDGRVTVNVSAAVAFLREVISKEFGKKMTANLF